MTDNELVGPNDVVGVHARRSERSAPAGSGGLHITQLYDINPNVFGQVSNLIRSTKDVGEDTRVFNGVDVSFTVRAAHGFTFQGGTSTGKVTNDWCEVRAAIPESYLLNPYCNVESPWQTSFRALASYTIPRIDVLVSSVFQDKPNVGTDQIVSLVATYTLTAADIASAQAQLGRPLTNTAPQVNLLAPGELYGDRVRQWDLSLKKIFRFGGQRLTAGVDMYNLLNNNVTLLFNPTFVPNAPGWQSPTAVHEPARVPSERRVRLVAVTQLTIDDAGLTDRPPPMRQSSIVNSCIASSPCTSAASPGRTHRIVQASADRIRRRLAYGRPLQDLDDFPQFRDRLVSGSRSPHTPRPVFMVAATPSRRLLGKTPHFCPWRGAGLASPGETNRCLRVSAYAGRS